MNAKFEDIKLHVNAKSVVSNSVMDVAKRFTSTKKESIIHLKHLLPMTVASTQALNNLIMNWEVLQSSMTLKVAAMMNTSTMKKYLPKQC